MIFSFRPTRNQISPDLARKLRAADDPRRALQAAGLVIESIAKRAFREPGARSSPWAELSPATVKAKRRAGKSTAILIRDALLARSPRITGLTRTSVTIGTDRPYARYHQLGKGTMYRPFFPIDRAGNLTPLGRERVEAALRKSLGM